MPRPEVGNTIASIHELPIRVVFSETQGIERGPELLRRGYYARFYPTLWQKLAD